MPRLDGKIAIITGGGRGQGLAEARLFVSEGARVVATDIDDSAADAIESLGSRALFIRQDVTSEEDWTRVVEAAVSQFGNVNVLVNNAGIYQPKPLQDATLSSFEKHIKVNQIGPFLGMQAVLKSMVAAGGGSIVNISSSAAFKGLPNQFSYSATKWALRGMTKCAASDFAPMNIRVNSIHPGLIDTPMLGGASKEMLDHYSSLIPMKRAGKASEVATAVLWLASDESSYITGAEFSIDGGVTL